VNYVVVRYFTNEGELGTPLKMCSFSTRYEAEHAAKVFADAFPDLVIGGAVFRVDEINTSH
jgi:hypothetical protein